MTLTHDPRRNIAYLRLRPPRGDVETVALTPDILLDLDETGTPAAWSWCTQTGG